MYFNTSKLIKSSLIMMVFLIIIAYALGFYIKRDNEIWLLNTEAENVELGSLAGQWNIFFFGFTNCPDVCPTALLDVSDIMDYLKNQSINIIPVFISVDPEHDTPDVIKEYMKNFDTRILAFTGSSQQLEKLTRSLGIFFRKRMLNETQYTIDHSSGWSLFDPEGNFVRVFSSQVDIEKTSKDMITTIQKQDH
jgi:protein SCO1/2